MKNISAHIESISGILEPSFYDRLFVVNRFIRGWLNCFFVCLLGISLWLTRRYRLQINLGLLNHRWVFLRWQTGRFLRRNFVPSKSVLALDPEPDPESESELVSPIEKFPLLASSIRGEDFSWDFPEGQISTKDSGSTGAKFPRGVPLCSMKDIPESSGVGVASGQLSPSMCQVLHLQHNTTFSFRILPWKEIFLGSIIGSPLVRKILTCFSPFLIFLLNFCLSLKTDTTSSKLEKASLSITERTNFFPEIQTYFRVAKTGLDLCTSKFLHRRFWSKDQNKLWRRNLIIQSTYLSHFLRF